MVMGQSGGGQRGPQAAGSQSPTSSGSGQGVGASQQGSGGVQSTVGQVADQAQQAAGQVADQAREQVTARAESQKERAVEALKTVAQAVRQTGQELRGKDQLTIAGYADRTAQSVEGVAGFLGNHDMREIMHETQRFARRNPALFLGGSFVLGLLGARFLKTSAPPPSPPAGHSPYTRPYSAPSYGTPSYGQHAAPSTYGTSPGYGSQPPYRPAQAASPTQTRPAPGQGGASASSTPSFQMNPLDQPKQDAPAGAGSAEPGTSRSESPTRTPSRPGGQPESS